MSKNSTSRSDENATPSREVKRPESDGSSDQDESTNDCVNRNRRENPNQRSPDSNRDLSRRSVLHGLGAASVGIVGIGTARAEPTESNETGVGTPDPSDGGDVEPQFLSGYSSSFSPYTVDVYDSSILESRWDVITPTIATYHRFDVLVEASKVYQPQPVASNFSSSDVEKNFEYTEDTALGVPAYHFKAIKLVAAPFGATIMLDTEVTPYSTGEVEAQTGVYQDPVYAISSGWAGAILDVE